MPLQYSNFIGTASGLSVTYCATTGLLKQQALLFDKIAVNKLHTAQDICRQVGGGFISVGADLEWLEEQGFVLDMPITDPQTGEFIAYPPDVSWNHWKRSFLIFTRGAFPDDETFHDEAVEQMTVEDLEAFKTDFAARILSLKLWSDGLDAVSTVEPHPIVDSMFSQTQKRDIAQIVIAAMPVPDETTAWEDIIDFRSDSDNRARLLALRKWMRKVVGEVQTQEISEELESLLHEYEQHMRLHHMKVNLGLLETVVTASAEFVEKLAKFKFGDAAKLPFSLAHRKIAILEAERSAQGREVAYIAKAVRAFE